MSWQENTLYPFKSPFQEDLCFVLIDCRKEFKETEQGTCCPPLPPLEKSKGSSCPSCPPPLFRHRWIFVAKGIQEKFITLLMLKFLVIKRKFVNKASTIYERKSFNINLLPMTQGFSKNMGMRKKLVFF